MQLAEPDCKAQSGELIIRIFNLAGKRPKIEFNQSKDDVPLEIKEAVKIWVKHQKYAGLSLQDYLDAIKIK